MFDIGFAELLLIGVVALIVVGPEDLPRMFRTLGRMTAKAKRMAREFSSALEDAAKESGIRDAASSLDDVRSLTSKKSLGLDALDRAADKFEKWEPKLPKPVPAGASPKAAAMPDPAAPAPVAAAAPAPVAVAAPAAIPEAAAEDLPEAGTRRLKAVRRSERKDA